MRLAWLHAVVRPVNRENSVSAECEGSMIRGDMFHPVLTVKFLVKRLREIRSKGLPKLKRASAADDFDQKYGVETAKWVRVVPTDSINFSHGNRYSPADEPTIRWCIENSGMKPDQTTFIDVGSGKGRALIVASNYPFKNIVGIEYSPLLAAIASKNLAKLGIDKQCKVIIADAANFHFPDDNLLVFIYNSFDSTILKCVLKNLAATRGRVCLAQLGGGHDVILASNMARVICSGEGPTLYEIIGSAR
jgi:SAM-dependent methyltransferase